MMVRGLYIRMMVGCSNIRMTVLGSNVRMTVLGSSITMTVLGPNVRMTVLGSMWGVSVAIGLNKKNENCLQPSQPYHNQWSNCWILCSTFKSIQLWQITNIWH